MSEEQRGRVPRKVGRTYVLGAIVIAIVIVFSVLLGVSQCAPNDPDSGDDPGQGNAVEQLVGVDDRALRVET
ncbi:hypothetical protein [Modestobacter sp. Leaf380]|uniref:hypothetical protein n=1 Tax=Modestobacter sp. Leaf380 TaxID=1736356 RepID=UPI0006F51600|nr:hypothetical protein [Modestobacter sp. Leaf380]KQS65875.1 hypothetical protein ASG41_15030 [Modestobacter sp. Leaf380]